jgi:predicted DNA binding CopG/RHH family protein
LGFRFKAEAEMVKEKRIKTFTIRVSASELDAMKDAAKANGIPLSKLIRQETIKQKPETGQKAEKP